MLLEVVAVVPALHSFENFVTAIVLIENVP